MCRLTIKLYWFYKIVPPSMLIMLDKTTTYNDNFSTFHTLTWIIEHYLNNQRKLFLYISIIFVYIDPHYIYYPIDLKVIIYYFVIEISQSKLIFHNFKMLNYVTKRCVYNQHKIIAWAFNNKNAFLSVSMLYHIHRSFRKYLLQY